MIRPDLIVSMRNERTQEKVMERSLSLLEDLRLQGDPSMKDWIPSGSNYDATTPPELQIVVLQHLRRQCRVAYYTNPYGRNIIRTLIKFVIGTGSMIDFTEKDEGKLKILNDYWEKVKKKIKWVAWQREYVRRLFRDGEVIVRKFNDENNPDFLEIRYVEPDVLKDTDIVFDEADPSTILKYKLYGADTDPEDVHFMKADMDANALRGRPILEPILPYLTKYSRWLDARMVLNIVRASVTLVQEVAGSPTNLLNVANKNLSNKQNAGQQKSKMLRPGTILRGTPGVKYNMLSPNLDARDAAQDGRTILLAVAASAGFPDTFVTADYANSNFASTIAAQNPAIREFEDWQQVISEGLSEIIGWFLDFGKESGQISQDTSLDFSFGFPPLIKRDLAQENTAYETMNQNKVCSRHTWAMRMGLDYDDEQKFIEEEPELAPSAPAGGADGPPPTRPEDRGVRQKIGAQRMQKQTQQLSFVVKSERGQLNERRVSVAMLPSPELTEE